MSGSHDKEVISPVALRSALGIVIDDFTTLPYNVTLTDEVIDQYFETGGTMVGGSRWTILQNSFAGDPRHTPVTLDVAGQSQEGDSTRLNLTVGAEQKAQLTLLYGTDRLNHPAPLNLDLSECTAFRLDFDAVGAKGIYHPWIEAEFEDPASSVPLTAFYQFKTVISGATPFSVEAPLVDFGPSLVPPWPAEQRTNVTRILFELYCFDDVALNSIEVV